MSVVEEGQINNLRSIMDIIQALGSMVASLQLASGRQQMGGHSRRGGPRRIQAQVARLAGVPAPFPRPPPDDKVSSRGQQSAPDTLEAVGASGQQDMCLHAFPALFTLLEDRQGASPRSRLERLATLTLMRVPSS